MLCYKNLARMLFIVFVYVMLRITGFLIPFIAVLGINMFFKSVTEQYKKEQRYYGLNN